MSLGFYYCSIVGLSSDSIAETFQNEAKGIAYDIIGTELALVLIVVVPVIALLPDYAIAVASQTYFPSLMMKYRNRPIAIVSEEKGV